jgi:nicotinamide-nucleotide amidase
MTDQHHLVEAIATIAGQHRLGVGVAESLTSGQLAAALGAGPDASSWFRGGVVAYAPEVKFDVLGVRPGPVVTASCAREMARGASRVLGAAATVAATGVGGPDVEEGEPPGTVYVATLVGERERCVRLELDGDPEQVLAATTAASLDLLSELLHESVAAGSTISSAHDGNGTLGVLHDELAHRAQQHAGEGTPSP